MTTAPKAPRRAGPAQALYRRLFVINAAVFMLGTLVLALSPATVSAPVVFTEIPVLIVGLAVMLTANGWLVRRSLAPLAALSGLLDRVDPIRPGSRMTDGGGGDLTGLIRSYNAMLDRLESERAASTAQALAAQEGERGRIARELHDEIGQRLTAVLLGLKRAVDRAPAGLREDLIVISDDVRSGLDDVRQVARRLRPGVLEDLGLRNALLSLTSDHAAATGVPVRTSIDAGLPELGGEIELVLYRIAQESLTNTARHAGARRVELILQSVPPEPPEPSGPPVPGEVRLRVRDDGNGRVLTEGAGIRGMRERAMLIGATLRLDARPGVGTEVALTVPVIPPRFVTSSGPVSALGPAALDGSATLEGPVTLAIWREGAGDGPADPDPAG